MSQAMAGLIGGVIAGAGGYFQLHQAVHHRFGAIERKLDVLSGDSVVAAKRFSQMERETLEEYVKRSAARQWNESLDEFYRRMIQLPSTLRTIYEDVQSKIADGDADKK